MSETVHVKVIKGSISTWKDGNFSKGDVFETTREEALKIDPSFIQILEDLPVEEPKEEPKQEAPEEPAAEEAEAEPTVTVEEVPDEPAPKKKRGKASADAS